jgi:predicted kinase
VYAGKETFTKEHLKTIPRISVENAFKETTSDKI